MNVVASIRRFLLLVMVAMVAALTLQAQEAKIVIDREGSTIVLESYAPHSGVDLI